MENMHYIPYEYLAITIAVIGIAMAFIVLTDNVVKAIHDWRSSAKKPENDRLDEQDGKISNHEQRIAHLEGCCSEVQGKLANDFEFQVDAVEINRLLLKSVKQLLKHGIDGNDKDGLKAMEEAIDGYLLEHQKIERRPS